MNNSLKPILSLSLAAAFAFGLAGCSNDPEPIPTQSPTTSTSTTPATPSQTPAPTTTPTTSASAAPVVVENELEEAKKAFPNVEAEGSISKEDIQLAALSATRYVNSIYNSGYLANGSWIKNGGDSQELAKIYGKDWSDSYRVKIESLVDGTKTGSNEEQTAAAKELLRHFFFYDNSGMTLPDDCSDNNVGVASCLVGEKLVFDSETTYQVNNETGAVYINVLFTANVKFVKDGVKGVTPVKYDVQLEMIKNPYPDVENFRYAYIVNDLGGNWKIEQWHEGE